MGWDRGSLIAGFRSFAGAVAKSEMEAETSAERQGGEGSNRRASPRLPVDGIATLVVLKHGSSVPCRVVDLSMGGCRIQSEENIVVGDQAPVEIAFSVRGLIFRYNGLTQWTDGHRQLGIRFVDVTARRWEELADLICELEQEQAWREAQREAEAQALEEAAGAARVEAEAEAESSPDLAENAPGEAAGFAESAGEEALESKAEGEPIGKIDTGAGRPVLRERRGQHRYEVDTSAAIYLINARSRVRGRILDLSLGGCRIRTNEAFPVGIYTRIETEFRLQGLPFRLGGVIQAVHDRERLHVGIRFLDVSARKREQVDQLIHEIEEMRAWKAQDMAAEADAGQGTAGAA